MKENIDYTIVYVFGPAHCEEKYHNDELLTREAGEWVKIGQTGFTGDIDQTTPEILKYAAMKRIAVEIKTGIPVVSKLYDVFIFPSQKYKIDDLLRNRLCNEIYEGIENSMQINKEIDKEDKFIIKAGQEFVYGIRKRNIKYAVQSYDHDLLVKALSDEDEEQIKLMEKICRSNDIDITNNDEEEDNVALTKRKPKLDLNMILQVGDKVVLTSDGSNKVVKDENGEAIIASYLGDNVFECKGEKGRSSYFAKKFLNMYAEKSLITVNGNEYWTYNGQKLASLRQN